VAHLKTKTTQLLWLDRSQPADFIYPQDSEMSYYKRLSAVKNYDSKWLWDFVFSDGSSAVGNQSQNLKMYKIRPENAQIKTIRLLYCKTNSYPTALVGLELLDFAN